MVTIHTLKVSTLYSVFSVSFFHSSRLPPFRLFVSSAAAVIIRLPPTVHTELALWTPHVHISAIGVTLRPAVAGMLTWRVSFVTSLDATQRVVLIKEESSVK